MKQFFAAFLLLISVGSQAAVVVRDSTTSIEHNPPGAAAQIHVSNSGNDSTGDGSESTPYATIAKALTEANFGDTILLECGSTFSVTVDQPPSDFTLTSYGGSCVFISNCSDPSENCPVAKSIDTSGNNNVISRIHFDGAKTTARGLLGRDADNILVEDSFFENYTNNCVDIDNVTSFTMDNVVIERCLNGSAAAQADAHGITVSNSPGAAINLTDVKIDQISGDAFQIDPSRNSAGAKVYITNPDWQTSALAADFNDWNMGEKPGENGLDTKQGSDDGDPIEIYITGGQIHGFVDLPTQSNDAALNIKENVYVSMEGVDVHDNEIAYRIRNTDGDTDPTIRGNPDVDIINNISQDNVITFRMEGDSTTNDPLTNIILHYNAFDTPVTSHLVQITGEDGSGVTASGNWWRASKPSIAGSTDLDESDGVANDDFVSYPSDLALNDPSFLADKLTCIPGVSTDIEGDSRPIGPDPKCDVGPFEDNVSPDAPPSSGGNDHYNTQCAPSSNLVACFHLRTDAQIAQYHLGPTQSRWFYDATLDAAKATFTNSMSFSAASQVKLTFPELSPDNVDSFSIQFDVFYSSEFNTGRANYAPDWNGNHKSIRIDEPGAPGNDGWFEYQTVEGDVSHTLNDAYTRAGIRLYQSTCGEPDCAGSDPIRLRPGGTGPYDEQPGGETAAWTDEHPYTLSDHEAAAGGDDTKPFLWNAGKWIRVTLWATYPTKGTCTTECDVRFKVWMADEDTDPLLAIDSEASPGSGFLLTSGRPSSSGPGAVLLEFNSSVGGGAPSPQPYVGVRNVIVWKNAQIPLGGRPVP